MPVRAILLLVLGPKGGRFCETVSGEGLAGEGTSRSGELGAIVLELMGGLTWVTSRRPGRPGRRLDSEDSGVVNDRDQRLSSRLPGHTNG